MKTLEQIKNELLSENHSRIYTFNGEEFEINDAEFNKAIEDKAQMLFEQQEFLAVKETEWRNKVSGYEKLGLTTAEIEALAPTPNWLLPQD
jgi:hypothetical protein